MLTLRLERLQNTVRGRIDLRLNVDMDNNLNVGSSIFPFLMLASTESIDFVGPSSMAYKMVARRAFFMATWLRGLEPLYKRL